MNGQRSHVRAVILSAAALFALLAPAWADEAHAHEPGSEANADEARANEAVVLANGTRIVGRIVGMEDGVLRIESPSTGVVAVDFADVVAIESDLHHTFVLTDSGRAVGRAGSGEGRRVRIETAHTGTVDVALGDIVAIDPQPPREATQEGNLVASFEIEDGTDKSKQASFIAEYIVRFHKRRLTLNGEWNYEEEDGSMTSRDISGSGKYDYFLSRRIFLYGNASAEGDEFDDLNLRTTIGGGLGAQLLDRDECAYYFETGVSFFNEDFDTDRDDRRVTSRVAHRLDGTIWPQRISLFHTAEAFFGYEGQKDSAVYTKSGLRFDLAESFFATLQVDFDYDNQPRASEQRRDTRYLFGLGYSF